MATSVCLEEENPPAFLDYEGRLEHNMNMQAIAGILMAVSAATNIIAQLVHTVGHVNHPVILDAVNAELQKVASVVSALTGDTSPAGPQTTNPPT